MTSRRLLDPASRVLLDAADYMEKHGFCKNTLEDDHGRVCVLGAINAVVGSKQPLEWAGFPAFEAHRRLSKQIVTICCNTESNLAMWNNHPKRTQEDVIAALRAAAIRCGSTDEHTC